MDENKEKDLVILLKHLEPGFLPLEIFMEIARLAVLPIIEFVPLRIKNGKVEVLLLRRDADDSLWPNELHTPGTVIRPTDLDSNNHLAFKRILEDELAETKVSEPYYVGSNLHKSRRGAEQAQIFWVEVLEKPKTGKFYPVNKLPSEMMESQIGFVKLAAKSFITSKKAP